MINLKKIAKKLVNEFHLLNDEIFNEIYTLGETETEKPIHDFLDTLGSTGTSKESIVRRIQKLEESRQSIAQDRLERHLADQKKIEGLLSDIDDLFSKMTIAQNQLREWEDWNNKYNGGVKKYVSQLEEEQCRIVDLEQEAALIKSQLDQMRHERDRAMTKSGKQ